MAFVGDCLTAVVQFPFLLRLRLLCILGLVLLFLVVVHVGNLHVVLEVRLARRLVVALMERFTFLKLIVERIRAEVKLIVKLAVGKVSDKLG